MLVKFHIQPGAKKDEIKGRHGDAVKVRLRAPPVDGKANDALVAFLADHLRIPRSAITIVKGHFSRQKLVEIKGCANPFDFEE